MPNEVVLVVLVVVERLTAFIAVVNPVEEEEFVAEDDIVAFLLINEVVGVAVAVARFWRPAR